MKKTLTLLVLFLFMTGMAFAQSNIGNVTQSGTSHQAKVEQTGGAIEAYVVQSNGFNVTHVTQINKLLWDDNSILSNVKQSGVGNEALIRQTHDGNLEARQGQIESLVLQSGDGNKVLQVQGPHGQMGTAYAKANQSGDHNTATQHQKKYGNDAFIYQSGDWNVAKQAQDTYLLDYEDGSFGYVLINQSGDGNLANQLQDGWSNNAEIFQAGNNNVASQTQYTWVSNAFIRQGGNWNTATQNQDGSLNNARIVQNSDGNTATQDQESGGRRTGANYADINYAEIAQWGGNNNVAKQMQDSPGGDVILNEAIIRQNGAWNIADQSQTGFANFSNIRQFGDGNKSQVIQINE